MTSDTMRAIDRLFGPPACFLLSLLYRVTGRFMPTRQEPVTDARRILFVKPAEMGSTVLAYPALLKAREQWPGCEILFLVFAENRAAVELLNLVEPRNIYCIRSDNFAHFVVDAVRCLWRLRRLRIDVAFDIEFFSRAAAILTALSGARWTAGFSRYTTEGLYKGKLLTHRVQYNPHIHTAAMFTAMVETLVQPPGQKPMPKVPVAGKEALRLPRMAPGAEQVSEMRALLRATNPNVGDDSRLIILNVNSSDLMPLRRWPLENFVELGRRLLRNPSVFIVLTGVRSEYEESRVVAQQLGEERCLNLVGKTSLTQLLVLYTLSDLMVTNDSGPSHFGCLTDIPTITLFGPETPEIYGPIGPGKVAVTAGLACSPCVSAFNHRLSPCTDNICMKSISVDQVHEISDRLLQEGSQGLS